MKKILSIILSVSLVFTLGACGKKADSKELTIGATAVPHAEILEEVKPILKEKGYDLEIKVFSDYVLPNRAVEDGELDANFFQHIPYLEEFNKNHKTNIVALNKVHLEPLGLYSKKIKSLDELKDGITITIPNDPTNGSRALKLLEENKVIKLQNKDLVSKLDIIENPKNIKIQEIDAPQLSRTLDDVEASIINTNYALQANLNPTKDAIVIEDKESPYANVIAVKSGNEEKEDIKALCEAITSEKIKKFIEEKYNGSIIPSF
ncbi:MAG TPA: methionine ABC transporter substrate-binding protein [Clostridium sp.]|nr:methionine ABC transporter substrate-binding protein [Clostridium sp.]